MNILELLFGGHYDKFLDNLLPAPSYSTYVQHVQSRRKAAHFHKRRKNAR